MHSGYFVSPGNRSALNLTVSVHSLSPELNEPPTTAHLALRAGGKPVPGGSQTTTVAPMAAANTSWVLDLTAQPAVAGVVEVAVSCQTAAGERLAAELVLKLQLGSWGELSVFSCSQTTVAVRGFGRLLTCTKQRAGMAQAACAKTRPWCGPSASRRAPATCASEARAMHEC